MQGYSTINEAVKRVPRHKRSLQFVVVFVFISATLESVDLLFLISHVATILCSISRNVVGSFSTSTILRIPNSMNCSPSERSVDINETKFLTIYHDMKRQHKYEIKTRYNASTSILRRCKRTPSRVCLVKLVASLLYLSSIVLVQKQQSITCHLKKITVTLTFLQFFILPKNYVGEGASHCPFHAT